MVVAATFTNVTVLKMVIVLLTLVVYILLKTKTTMVDSTSMIVQIFSWKEGKR